MIIYVLFGGGCDYGVRVFVDLSVHVGSLRFQMWLLARQSRKLHQTQSRRSP